MPSFIANSNAENKIKLRYAVISFTIVLVIAVAIVNGKFYYLFTQPDKLPNYLLYFFMIFFLYFLYSIFIWQPGRLAQIIRSIEVNGDNLKITTFGFYIKYFPLIKEPVVFETDRRNIVSKKMPLNLNLVNSLPFAGAYSIRNNNKDYYLVPSLFEGNEVINAVSTNTAHPV